MPTYVLTNTETNETYTELCSWDNLQTILKDNPHIKQEMTAPAIVGDHVTAKTDGGMKEVFSKIAEKHPSSALADRFGNKSNAKVKAETIAKKHGLVSKTGGQDLSKRFKKNKDTGLY